MIRIIFISLLTLVLSACGGSRSKQSDLNAPITQPDMVQGISNPLFPANYNVTTCSGLDLIQLLSVVENAADTLAEFDVNKAIDNDLSPESRWETTKSGPQITIELGYRHLVKEVGTAWFNGEQQRSSFDVAVSEDGSNYTTILTNEISSGLTNSIERFDTPDTVARFVRLTSNGNLTTGITALSEIAIFGCPLDVGIAPIQTQNVDISQFNLDPNLAPGANFDLLTWALDTPRTDPDDGFSLRASERELDGGFIDPDYFYTGLDGGMVFKATIFGATTSANSSFTRSELREMLRRGNTSIKTQGVNLNNWVLGYQPIPPRTVGGRGGLLQATLKVNQVTTTGSQLHTGRVVIGQIHADDDEPIRLYFKKFPNNDRGYLYFAHEIKNGDDIYRMVLGPAHDNEDNQPKYTNNPEQGIKLDEIFSYEINQQGARIDVLIRRGDINGPIIGHQFVDMQAQNSGYDVVEEWNYFKAGAYSQNNTGESGDSNGVGSDFDLITFYYLSNSHSDP